MDEKNIQYIKAAFYFGLVGLALVVFAVLFSGFIRKAEEDKKELRAVRRIVTELAYYEFIQTNGSRQMAEVAEAADRLLEDCRKKGTGRAESEIRIDLHKLTWLFHSGTPTTQYSVLNASGDFDLIQSIELQDQLMQFHADVEKLIMFEEIQVRYVDQQLRPFLNRNTDRTGMEVYGAPSKPDSVMVQYHGSPFEFDLDDLLANREFANILVDVGFHTDRLKLPYDRMGIGIERMKETIEVHYPEVGWKPYVPF